MGQAPTVVTPPGDVVGIAAARRQREAEQLPLFDGFRVQTLQLQLAGGVLLPLREENHRDLDGACKLLTKAVVTVTIGDHTFTMDAEVTAKTAKFVKGAEGTQELVRVIRLAVE